MRENIHQNRSRNNTDDKINSIITISCVQEAREFNVVGDREDTQIQIKLTEMKTIMFEI